MDGPRHRALVDSVQRNCKSQAGGSDLRRRRNDPLRPVGGNELQRDKGNKEFGGQNFFKFSATELYTDRPRKCQPPLTTRIEGVSPPGVRSGKGTPAEAPRVT